MMRKKCLCLLVILVCLSGCSVDKKDDIVLNCWGIIESEYENLSQEKINYDFNFTTGFVEKTVVGIVEKEELNDEEIDDVKQALQQNYCNSEIKNNYSCNVDFQENQVIVLETGEINKVLGIKEKLSKKEVVKILKKKNFTCDSKKNDTINSDNKSGVGLDKRKD